VKYIEGNNNKAVFISLMVYLFAYRNYFLLNIDYINNNHHELLKLNLHEKLMSERMKQCMN
jgi:hypothetical protein